MATTIEGLAPVDRMSPETDSEDESSPFGSEDTVLERGMMESGSDSDNDSQYTDISDTPTDSDSPSDRPSDSPSDRPSDSPSDSTSDSPSDRPSDSPSDRPSESSSDSQYTDISDTTTDSSSESIAILEGSESTEAPPQKFSCDDIGRFEFPPVPHIPPEAYEAPVEITLLGFDDLGGIYVQFRDRKIEFEQEALLDDILQVYTTSGPNTAEKLQVGLTQLHVGELVIVKIKEDYLERFIRGRVLSVMMGNGGLYKVIVVDIDDHIIHEAQNVDLFWMTELVAKFPTKAVKSSLRFCEAFEGSPAIPGLYDLLPTHIKESTLYAQAYNDPIAAATVPSLKIYADEPDVAKKWLVNHEILIVLARFNLQPLNLKSGMVLTDAAVVHALPNGIVWIQFQSSVTDHLLGIQPLPTYKPLPLAEHRRHIMKLIKLGERRFVEYRRDDNDLVDVFRCYVSAINDIDKTLDVYGMVLVEHVDFGSTYVVHIDYLLPYDAVGLEYRDIPPQAFRAKLWLGPEGRRHEDLHLSPEDIKAMTYIWTRQEIVIINPSVKGEDDFPEVEVWFMVRGPVQSFRRIRHISKYSAQDEGTVNEYMTPEFACANDEKDNDVDWMYEEKRPNFKFRMLPVGQIGIPHGMTHLEMFESPNLDECC